MAEYQLPKLNTRVRFPSPAFLKPCGKQGFLYAAVEVQSGDLCRKNENPNPFPLRETGSDFCHAGNRTRTCTVSHQNLNLARLPIPPYLQKK